MALKLYTDSVEDLYDLIDQLDGELILDLSVDAKNKYPYIRIYQDDVQYMIVKPLGDDPTDGHNIKTRSIEEQEFEYIIENTDVIRLKHRSDTPFSRETQQQIRDNRKDT